jgi:hypothetical protein
MDSQFYGLLRNVLFSTNSGCKPRPVEPGGLRMPYRNLESLIRGSQHRGLRSESNHGGIKLDRSGKADTTIVQVVLNLGTWLRNRIRSNCVVGQ